MSPAPETFLSHLQTEGYHSRSNKHSNALALAIVADLVAHCRAVRSYAARGELVYDLNFKLRAATADWNVDLVLGAPGLGSQPSSAAELIQRQTPATIHIAIEIKSVMTEHRKAIKNRKRDLEAHHEHVHNYSQEAIAGGVLVINSAPQFRSPLRDKPTVHRNPARLVQHCLAELRAVASRGGPTGYGLEAKCGIVVDMDNENLLHTRYVSTSPAPAVGDPLHYDGFIRAICQHYEHRFGQS